MTSRRNGRNGTACLESLSRHCWSRHRRLQTGDSQHGEVIFKKYCQGCHGADGNGGGKGFMPHVGPLARKGYIDQLPDEYLATVISQGGEATGKSAFMPSWKTTLTEQDIADVIAYIRTFAAN